VADLDSLRPNWNTAEEGGLTWADFGNFTQRNLDGLLKTCGFRMTLSKEAFFKIFGPRILSDSNQVIINYLLILQVEFHRDFLYLICFPPSAIIAPPPPPPQHDWIDSVFFLFVHSDLSRFTVKQLKAELLSRNLTQSGLREELETHIGLGIWEISGTAFAISPRRVITCHHCIFNENERVTLNEVAFCSSIMKAENNRIIPHSLYPVYHADLHVFDAALNYAIFNLRPAHPNLTPIPICPVEQLPTLGYGLTCYYGSGVMVAGFESLVVWKAGPHSILQYCKYATDPIANCRNLTEHPLCGGTSGGAIVTNDGYVVAIHLSSLNQGETYVQGSSLCKKRAKQRSLAALEDEEIDGALTKEGLVLCRIPQIMEAVNNP